MIIEPDWRSAGDGGTYRLLAGQYVTQFIGGSFLATAVPAILRDAGVGLGQLAVLPLLMLIPIARVLWAPLVDHGVAATGSYRSWLLILQPSMAMVLVMLVPLDPVTDLEWVLAVMVVMALVSSTKDVAVDAVAIRALQPRGRSIASGLQSAGSNAGQLIGGGLVLVVYELAGWTAAVLLLVGCVLLPVWQINRYQEPTGLASAPVGVRSSYRAAAALLRGRQPRRWALMVAPLLWLGIGAVYGLITPMLVDAGWSLSRIGLTVHAVGVVVGIVGGVAAGWLAARIGLRRSLHVAAALQAGALLALVPLAQGTATVVVATVVVGLLQLSFAVVATTAAATAMNLCRDTTAGTDFALLNAVPLAASLACGAVGLAVAGAVGYPAVVAAAVAAAVVSQVGLRWFSATQPADESEPRVRGGTAGA